MPIRTMAVLASAALAVAGCTLPDAAPDTVYRQALESAVEAGQCEGPGIDALWSSYRRWYAVSASIAHYHPASEAEALLRQAEMFRILGCPAVVRATYEFLLQRFPGPAFAAERETALRGLTGLGPPLPLFRPGARTDGIAQRGTAA